MPIPKSARLTEPCPTCGQAELRLHEKQRNLTRMVTCFSCRKTFYEGNGGELIETNNSKCVAGSLKPSKVDRAAMSTAEKRRKEEEKHESLRNLRRPT